MTRVFIIRHGETEWNSAGLLQGSADIELTERGREQARLAAAVLAEHLSPGVTIVSSPLVRAHDTALEIAQEIGTTVHVDDRLRERAYGVWEGITPEERQRSWPEAVQRWREHGNPEVPGFEVHDEVQARMVASIEEWVERAPADVLIASHGSSSRLAMMGLLGLPLNHRSLGNLGNCEWSRLTRHAGGDWTLERHRLSVATVGVAL